MASSDNTASEAADFILVSQFSADAVVTLLVGEDEQTMIVHSSQLTRDSEFFTAAMKKEWVEGQTRVIRLPEERPATMAHYLSFLHSGRLFAEEITTLDKGPIKHCYSLLASLYVCGERYLNRRLQSAIIVQMFRLTRIPGKNSRHFYPSRTTVNTVYRGTPEGSPGRRLLVDLHIIKGCKAWLEDGDYWRTTTSRRLRLQP
jgi:hypothetical protein